jgi:asparaginyl-tRNA synthetase
MRTPFQSLLVRTRSQMIQSVIKHFNEAEGGPIVQVHPPLITSSDCEGAGEVFTIAPKTSVPATAETSPQSPNPGELYFREPKYLTVSSQLHLEAYSAELGDVWTLSPTFRAEESDTPRHLSEFYMLEAEYRGLDTLEHLLSRAQKLIQAVALDLQQHRTGQELLDYYADPKRKGEESDAPDLRDRWARLSGTWEVLSYSEVMAGLQEAHAASSNLFRYPPEWDKGLQLEHERWAVEHLSRGKPLFVTDYPKAIKPFYMRPSASQAEQRDKATVACFDLLLPFGFCEVVGGSLREHGLEQLIRNMRAKGLLKKTTMQTEPLYPFLEPGESLGSLEWYADLRRFGSSPHGGFGMGFDRLLAYLTGVSNVRDVVAFPRTWGRADC